MPQTCPRTLNFAEIDERQKHQHQDDADYRNGRRTHVFDQIRPRLNFAGKSRKRPDKGENDQDGPSSFPSLAEARLLAGFVHFGEQGH